MRSKLLLVDDDHFIRRIIGESLTQLGYAVDVAIDGNEAWEKMDCNPQGYDLILLDRDMPNMDGIALLKRIKADERLASLPVVMLTGADRAEDVAEGLAVGAHYYLTKPATQVILHHVIQNALEDYQRTRELRERLGKQKNNLSLLRQAKFTYRTLQEAKDIALFLADASMKPTRTVPGYSELLINAVEHGNLGITYAEKGKLLENDCWDEEVKKRLQLPQYAERVVEVVMDRNPDGLVVTITDQGNGFDWHKYLKFSPDRAFDLHGRGIAMSSELSFDKLEYLGKGNSVVTTVLHPNQSA